MVSKQNVNYVNKILREFKGKNWDLSRVLGRGGKQTALRSQKNFEKFKEKVKEARSYYKEREKIHRDYLKIQQRYEANNTHKKLNREKEQKQALLDTYKDKKIVRMIWSKRKELGLENIDFYNKNMIQKKIAKKMKRDLTEEITFNNNRGKEKSARTIGAFFKNHSEEWFVEEGLQKIYKMIENDPRAMENIALAQDYLYNTIIPQKYEGRNPQYSSFKKSDDEFWEDVTNKLVKYYKSLRR